MEDFVIMSVKNFSHVQNYYNWKDMESLFVPPPPSHMYNSNTNNLIMVGAYLMKKVKKKKKRFKNRSSHRLVESGWPVKKHMGRGLACFLFGQKNSSLG